MTSTKGAQLAEGKTKVIWEDFEHPAYVLIESKDDITAGDGAQRDELEGKALAGTETTCNVFEYLSGETRAPMTHYVERVDERTFRALRCEMVAIEWVARRVATGSYLKRNQAVPEGTIFEHLVIESFLKDDDRHDPLAIWDFVGQRTLVYEASKCLHDGFLEEALWEPGSAENIVRELSFMANATGNVFLSLEEAWAKQNVQLVDMKIEFGRRHGNHELVVADVIDNDSWRIWPAGDKSQMKDKQVYRDLADVDDPAAKAKALGKIKQDYAWVAEATSKF